MAAAAALHGQTAPYQALSIDANGLLVGSRSGSASVTLGAGRGITLSGSGAWLLAQSGSVVSLSAANVWLPTTLSVGSLQLTTSTAGLTLLTATNSAHARSLLGLVIGTDVQAYSAITAALAAGTWSGSTALTQVGVLTAGSASTGFTIHLANVTLTGQLTNTNLATPTISLGGTTISLGSAVTTIGALTHSGLLTLQAGLSTNTVSAAAVSATTASLSTLTLAGATPYPLGGSTLPQALIVTPGAAAREVALSILNPRGTAGDSLFINFYPRGTSASGSNGLVSLEAIGSTGPSGILAISAFSTSQLYPTVTISAMAVTVSGSFTASNSFTASGASTFGSTVNVVSTVSLGGTLSVSGLITGSTITTSGTATLSSIYVPSTLTIASLIRMNGASSLRFDQTVTAGNGSNLLRLQPTMTSTLASAQQALLIIQPSSSSFTVSTGSLFYGAYVDMNNVSAAAVAGGVVYSGVFRGGNFGVGTLTPSTTFAVSGSSTFTGSATITSTLSAANISSSAVIYAASGINAGFTSNTSSFYAINLAADASIAGTVSAANLVLSNTVYADAVSLSGANVYAPGLGSANAASVLFFDSSSGLITYDSSPSDPRTKERIAPLQLGLRDLLRLADAGADIAFNYKKGFNSRPDVRRGGLNARALAEVSPLLVKDVGRLNGLDHVLVPDDPAVLGLALRSVADLARQVEALKAARREDPAPTPRSR